MSRLIDADALKEFIDDCGICAICPQRAPRCSYDCDFPDSVTEKWDIAIDAQPTIDAVSVVRCKECKWAKANGTYQWCGRLDSTARITADDFCSYGERKDKCKECWHWSEFHKRCENNHTKNARRVSRWLRIKRDYRCYTIH